MFLKSRCAKAEPLRLPWLRSVTSSTVPPPPPGATSSQKPAALLHRALPHRHGGLGASLRLRNVMQPVQPRSLSSLLWRQQLITPPSPPPLQPRRVRISSSWVSSPWVSSIQAGPSKEHISLGSLQITLGFHPSSLALQDRDPRQRRGQEWDSTVVQQRRAKRDT